MAAAADHSDEYIVEIRDASARALVPERGETAEGRSQRFHATKSPIIASLGDGTLVRDYPHLPLLHVRVRNPQALNALRNRRDVAAVRPNVERKAELIESLPLINQPAAVAGGFTGNGTSVAILDTGVDYTHAAFGSCTAPGVPAGCRVVVAKDFAWEDGMLDDDGHGTNVAAIAAGVATQTNILALDVFEYYGAWDSDIIAAIEFTIANKATYNIASLNMSLGDGSLHSSPCANDSLAPAVAAARAAGIMVVTSAGNSSSKTGIGSPACTPGAVSVGAVYDANVGATNWSVCADATTEADKVVCFSNRAPIMTLFAPGSKITAGGYTFSGTSMASPHVAGAAAVLRAAFPGASVDDLVARMTLTGRQISDHASSLVKPRLDLNAAASATNFATDLIANGSFENGAGRSIPSWTMSGPGERTTTTSYDGVASLWMGGVITSVDTAEQAFTIPNDATLVSLSFALSVVTAEDLNGPAADWMTVELLDGATNVMLLVASNEDAALNSNNPRSFLQKIFDLRPYKGKTLTVKFRTANSASNVTSFFVDTVRVMYSREGSASLTSLTPSLVSPQRELTAIKWTAVATGGVLPRQFRFHRYSAATDTWTMVRDWSAGDSVQWSPALGDAGTYKYKVEVRSNGGTDAEASLTSPDYVIEEQPRTPTITSVTSSLPSPQNGGTSITWTATAVDGIKPLQYRFWRYSATENTWTMVRDWDYFASWTWLVPSAASGDFVIQVEARSSGNYGTVASARPPVMTINPLVAEFVSLTADKPSPQNAGPTITYTALARGGATPLYYRFFKFNYQTGLWTQLRDWSTLNTIAIPTAGTGGDFLVHVDIKSTAAAAIDTSGRSSVMTIIQTPLVVTSFKANKTSPQSRDTYITWNVVATGGIAPLQYRFSRYNSATNTWTTPTSWSTYPYYDWYASQYGDVIVQAEIRGGNSTQAEVTVRSEPITITYIPATVINLYTYSSSPRPVNSTIYWYTDTYYGTYPYLYRWWAYHAQSNTWSLLLDWTAYQSTLYWQPTVTGTYLIQVDVRSSNVGFTESSKRSSEFVITSSTSTPSITAPAGKLVEGSPLSWTVSPGSDLPHEYRFWRFSYASGTWTLAQDFSTSATYTWNTGAGDAGTYLVQAEYRYAGETNVNALRTDVFTIERNPSLLSITSVSANVPSPAHVGQTVTWTANGDGNGPAEYRFWLFSYTSGTWSLLRDFGSTPSASWNPSAAGNYLVQTDVRAAGSANVAASGRSAVYLVEP